MAELDFAFLAEHVRIEPSGIMTAVGLNITHLYASTVPSVASLAVAGRLWLDGEEAVVPLSFVFSAPEEGYVLTLETNVSSPAHEPLLDGRRAAPFVANVTLPIVGVGLYSCVLQLGDDPVKSLAVLAQVGEPPDQAT